MRQFKFISRFVWIFVRMTTGPGTEPLLVTLSGTAPAPLPSPAVRVSGIKTKLLRLTRAEAAVSAYLEPWLSMVNVAYVDSFEPDYVPQSWKRLPSAEELLQKLNNGAIIFLVVADHPHDLQVLASVVAQPYTSPTEEERKTLDDYRTAWLIPETPEYYPKAPRWHLRFLCVAPEVQRQGLASWLLELIEGEVQRTARTAASTAKATNVIIAGEESEKELGVVMVISTFKETTGAFYMRKGWRTMEDRWMPPGFIGSQTGFFASFMDKYLPL